MRLEIEGLVKRYGARAALDELSLCVDECRVLVLIGPSGGGKSTLLRMLGGLDVPDSGTMRINREDVPRREMELMRFRRRNGFLFQQFNLFPHLTALRNVSLPLEKVHGLAPEAAERLARETLARFGLAGHSHHLPAQLSGGQQQRVGIARAVARRPEVLFLDEPTSALDPEMTAEVLELVEELARDGQDIILSTHEMGFARAVADHVAFVAEGRIAECGTPGEVFGAPQSAECKRFLSRVMRW